MMNDTVKTHALTLVTEAASVATLVDLGFNDPQVSVDTVYSQHRLAHVVRILHRYWAERGTPKLVKYPASWTDHLKQRVMEGNAPLLRWAVGKMNPIQYATETLTPRACFKHASLPAKHRDHILYYVEHSDSKGVIA